MIKFLMICPYDILFIIGFYFAVMEEICLVKTRSVCSSHHYHCLKLFLSRGRKWTYLTYYHSAQMALNSFECYFSKPDCLEFQNFLSLLIKVTLMVHPDG